MIKTLQSQFYAVTRWFLFCLVGWLAFKILRGFALNELLATYPQLENPVNILANGLPVLAFAILMSWSFMLFVLREIILSRWDFLEEIADVQTKKTISYEKESLAGNDGLNTQHNLSLSGQEDASIRIPNVDQQDVEQQEDSLNVNKADYTR